MLWILQNTAETTSKKVTLYLDNQSVILTLKTPSTTAGQHLIQSLLQAANDTSCSLSIKWISSHSEVTGNERADRLAKKAAEGQSSATLTLPHILRTPLPRSASAIKQAYNAQLRKTWSEKWNISLRKNRLAQMGEPFPFKKFNKNLLKLTRKQSSLVLQICSRHLINYINKTKHLKTINQANP